MRQDKRVPFVEYLEKLRDQEDRAALAALRRGLGRTPAEAAEMHRYVVPWLPPETRRWDEDCHYLVAALFASHPAPGGSGSMGDTLARVAQKGNAAAVERRFVALLKSHPQDLADRLRHVVSLARAHDVPVHWHQLFRDVRDWQHPAQYVQRNWARDFWSALAPPTVGEETEQVQAKEA